MAVKHSVVTVTTSAGSLLAGVADAYGISDSAYVTSRRLTVQNPGPLDVFIGGSTVTTTTFGYKLASGGVLSLELSPDDTPYVISTASQAVNLLHLGI